MELLVYKYKSRKRSFNDQFTVKPYICGIYFGDLDNDFFAIFLRANPHNNQTKSNFLGKA